MTAAANTTAAYLDVEGGRLYYEVAGAGHPLILMHAGVCDARMWDDQVPVFAAHFRVVRYDVRGIGRSTNTAEQFSHRADLAALLAHLTIGRAYLVGVSMSGSLAVDFTLEHPQMVAALVAVTAGVSGGPPPLDLQPLWDEADQKAEAGDIDGANEIELQMWVDGPGQPRDRVDPAVRERVRVMNRPSFAPSVGSPQPLEPPAIGRLAAIAVPTLVIIGDLDQPKVLQDGERLATGIPGARRAVMAGTAHLPNLERPLEFNRLVLDFLQEVEARQTQSGSI